MALNDSNFLIWFNSAIGEDEFQTPAPRPFVLEPEVISPAVWLTYGESYSFYVNSPDNFSRTEPLGLLHENNIAYNAQQGAILSAIFPGGAHRYGTFVVPNTIPEGLCRLTLGNYRTQWLYLTNPTKANRFSAVIRFRNGHRLQNIRYSYLPDTFYQELRVRLSIRGNTPRHEKQVYTESTTGKRRGYYSEPGWVTTYETPEYDYWMHRAMAGCIEHDEVFINGVPQSFETGYKTNTDSGNRLSSGEFEMRDENYSTLNRP